MPKQLDGRKETEKKDWDPILNKNNRYRLGGNGWEGWKWEHTTTSGHLDSWPSANEQHSYDTKRSRMKSAYTHLSLGFEDAALSGLDSLH